MAVIFSASSKWYICHTYHLYTKWSKLVPKGIQVQKYVRKRSMTLDFSALLYIYHTFFLQCFQKWTAQTWCSKIKVPACNGAELLGSSDLYICHTFFCLRYQKARKSAFMSRKQPAKIVWVWSSRLLGSVHLLHLLLSTLSKTAAVSFVSRQGRLKTKWL
jgi:hypothetical protein